MNRRNALQALAATSGLVIAGTPVSGQNKPAKAKFRFSLNTSTVSGQKPGIEKYIDIAARAGYECIEPWIGDIKAYIANGGSVRTLRKLLDDSNVAPHQRHRLCSLDDR